MNFNYILKEGIAGIRRAKLAATTSIFSLFIALLLIGILARVFFGVYNQAMHLKEVEIEIFLYDLDKKATDEIKLRLEEEELITDIHYISKDSASAIAAKDLGEGIEDLLALNFFPASYRVVVNTDAGADIIEALASRLKNIRGVEEVKYNAALLRILESYLSVFSLAGAGIGLLILLASVILIYNTIRLTIYAKKDLIRAMKLVGATNKFIRSPFVIEGIIQGLIGGLMAVICVFLVFQVFIPFYLPNIGVIEWPYGRWYFQIGAMLFIAILMGWWGSRLASRKFIAETYISG